MRRFTKIPSGVYVDYSVLGNSIIKGYIGCIYCLFVDTSVVVIDFKTAFKNPWKALNISQEQYSLTWESRSVLYPCCLSQSLSSMIELYNLFAAEQV